jgi:hypothetical protein
MYAIGNVSNLPVDQMVLDDYKFNDKALKVRIKKEGLTLTTEEEKDKASLKTLAMLRFTIRLQHS